MSMMIRMVTILLFMNICVYLGTSLVMSSPDQNGLSYPINKNLQFRFNGDLLDLYFGNGITAQMDSIMNNTLNNYTDYNINYTGDWNKIPESQTGGIGGLTTFIDSLNTVYSFIKTLGNVVLAPITLFMNFRMPAIIGIMIGLPYSFVFMMTLIFFIRGLPS